jgi:hypothetical protein
VVLDVQTTLRALNPISTPCTLALSALVKVRDSGAVSQFQIECWLATRIGQWRSPQRRQKTASGYIIMLRKIRTLTNVGGDKRSRKGTIPHCSGSGENNQTLFFSSPRIGGYFVLRHTTRKVCTACLVSLSGHIAMTMIMASLN